MQLFVTYILYQQQQTLPSADEMEDMIKQTAFCVISEQFEKSREQS